MKFAPFKPCTLPKRVRVEILHREFPVKNLYFPCKGLQCSLRISLEKKTCLVGIVILKNSILVLKVKSSLPTTPLYLTRSIFHLKSVSSSSSVPEFHKLAKSELKIFIRKSKMFLKQVLVTCFLWTLVNSCTTTEKPNNGSGIQKRQVVCGNEGPQYCEGTIEFIPSILRRKFRYTFSHLTIYKIYVFYFYLELHFNYLTKTLSIIEL